MLYDPDTSLSRDGQSTREAEQLLADELRRLRRTKPGTQLADKQRLLHFIQDKQFYVPHVVSDFGSQLARFSGRSLGGGLWELLERTVVASLSARRATTAQWALDALRKRFGASARVQRLQALSLEARGQLDEADEHYAEQLEAEPTSLAAMRRQVAVAKADGNIGLAIALLSRYVSSYAADEHAWLELCELYASVGQLQAAAFAAEEALLLQPEHYALHARYADLQFARGEYDTARQHYSQSIELKPDNNLRALYGLQACIKRATPNSGSSASSGNASSGANLSALWQWSEQHLLAHYRLHQPHLAPLVQQAIVADAVAAGSQAQAGTAPAVAAAVAAAASSATSLAAAASAASAVSMPLVALDDAAAAGQQPQQQQRREAEMPD